MLLSRVGGSSTAGGAERLKALVPMVERRVEGRDSWMEAEDRRVWEGVVIWRRADMCGGRGGGGVYFEKCLNEIE